MSELLTMQDLANGHLDIKALGEAANGDENTIVTTRTGNTYPSAKKAISEGIITLFENGGLPAEPFETKSQMQTEGASLVDGDYAAVTNDTADNNGIYIKKSGAWSKTSYGKVELPVDMIRDKSNLFDGTYQSFVLATNGSVLANYGSLTGSVAVVKVKPATSYYIYSPNPDSHNLMRIALFDAAPTVGGKAGKVVIDSVELRELSITTQVDTAYIAIYVSNQAETPDLFVAEGDINTQYKKAEVISLNSIETPSLQDLNFQKGRSENLFNGVYIRDTHQLSGRDTVDGISTTMLSIAKVTSSSKTRTAIIPIKGSTRYSYKAFSADLYPFWVAVFDKMPEFGSGLNTTTAVQVLNGGQSERELTFTSHEDAKYLVLYVSNSGIEPRLNVVEGEQVEEFIPYYNSIPQSLIEKISIEKELVRSENLIMDKVFNYTIVSSGANAILQKSQQATIVITRVKAGESYTVTNYMDAGYHIKKLAIFSEDPSSSSFNEAGTSSYFVDNVNKDKSIIVSAQEDGYLCVETTYFNSEQLPKVQVTSGGEVTEYKRPNVIPHELIETQQKDKDMVSGAVFTYFTDLSGLYNFSGELPKNIDGVVSNRSIENLHRDFRSVAADSNGFIEITGTGTAEGGYPVYMLETNPTDLYYQPGQGNAITEKSRLLQKPKIVITTGIHGQEKAPNYAAYHLLKLLSENPAVDSKIDFIRRNVKLVIIPVINATGYVANSYHNINDINLNRDFPPSATASQSETRFVVECFKEHRDMNYHLDYHNSGIEGCLGYTLTDEAELAYMACSAIAELGRKEQLSNPLFIQDPAFRWSFSTPANDGTCGKFTQEALGVKSAVFELHSDLKSMNNGMSNPELATLHSNMSLDLLVNMIIGCVRNLQAISK